MHVNQPETKNCLFCGREFTPKRYWQRFHTDTCRNTFHTMTRRRYMEEMVKLRAVETSLRRELEAVKAAPAARIAPEPVYGPGLDPTNG